jgi:hypothetical protein
MMSDLLTTLAESAYNAYGETTDFKNYQGLPMPKWNELSERIQSAWKAAVNDVMKQLNVRDTETDTPLYSE